MDCEIVRFVFQINSLWISLVTNVFTLLTIGWLSFRSNTLLVKKMFINSSRLWNWEMHQLRFMQSLYPINQSNLSFSLLTHPNRKVPLFFQKSGHPPEGLAVWVCHLWLNWCSTGLPRYCHCASESWSHLLGLRSWHSTGVSLRSYSLLVQGNQAKFHVWSRIWEVCSSRASSVKCGFR